MGLNVTSGLMGGAWTTEVESGPHDETSELFINLFILIVK